MMRWKWGSSKDQIKDNCGKSIAYQVHRKLSEDAMKNEPQRIRLQKSPTLIPLYSSFYFLYWETHRK